MYPNPLCQFPRSYSWKSSNRSCLGLGFAGGAMVWMIFSELLPDALEETSDNLVAIAVTLSVVAMVAFQFLIR